jgi:hypothetical protein
VVSGGTARRSARHDPWGCRERERNGNAAGGHPHFLGRHLSRRSAAGARRHRYPPRDLVDSRTAREATSRSGGRTGAPSGATVRQAPPKDARQVEWRRTAARAGRERCLWKNRRYSPLRELATTRRQALPRDGRVASPGTICDEPSFASTARSVVSGGTARRSTRHDPWNCRERERDGNAAGSHPHFRRRCGSVDGFRSAAEPVDRTT